MIDPILGALDIGLSDHSRAVYERRLILDSPNIHRSAAMGFEASPDAYERGRADYPQEAILILSDRLQLAKTSTVVDLGAGTGKLTRALLPVGCTLIAVEPVTAMRRALTRLTPGVEVLDGCAEDIPLDSGSVDAVICAQAFHWFDGPPAAREIRRVLKPGGTLGLIWNVRDESVKWVADLTRIMDPYAGDTPRYRTGRWKEALEGSEYFHPLSKAHCEHEHAMSLDAAIDRVTSISFIAALPETERATVTQETRAVLHAHLESTGDDEIKFPYRVDIFWTTRKP